MSRFVISLFSLLLFFSCQPDAEKKNTDVQSPEPKIAPVSTKVQAPKTENGETLPTTNNTLTLTALNKTAVSGEESCVQVRVDGFTDLLGMQYTLRWAASMLRYKRTMVGKFPQFTTRNINEQQVDRGLMPIVWIDNDLKGISLPDGTILYQVCFDVIGQAGQKAEIGFTNQPTAFEVVNKQEEILVFRGQTGMLSIE